MQPDPRELRLRRHFGRMMAWTALALLICGALLGSAFDVLLAAAGDAFGFMPGTTSRAAVKIAGDVVVGCVVLFGIVRAYLAPLGKDV